MTWNQFALASDGSAALGSRIARVSRIPNSMEFWWIEANGSVQGAFWYEGGNWGRYELAPAGSASTSGGIAAVSRVPNSMELWFVGANGSVQDHFWYDGGTWQSFELAPAGSASTSGGIAAVSRVPNSMELWFVGANGSVQDHFWYDTGDPSIKTFDAGVTTDIAVGGSAHVVMKQNGSFTFSCHAHDSGFDNISYTISAAALTPDGIVFTFQHSGHTEGTIAGLPFGTPNRNDDFQIGGANPQITAEWAGLSNASFKASIAGTDTLAQGIAGALGDLVKELLAQAEKAVASAVIALVVA
jgi:hypothetical protein